MPLRQLDIGMKNYLLIHRIIKNKTGVKSSLASFLKFLISLGERLFWTHLLIKKKKRDKHDELKLHLKYLARGKK